ncbi:MAG: nucleotidyltransferase family protein [Verrucomicrobiota bacterium]
MKAMVLCAGFGTRLGDLTREVPKPMLDVAGKPLLEHILAQLARHGFTDVAVNLHFKPELIRDYFGDGTKWNVRLNYSYESALLGTAGGVKNFEHFFRGERDFLVHYGDILTDQDFTAMVEFHRKRRAMATLLVHERARSNSILKLNAEGRIVTFLERPPADAWKGIERTWVNSGICICNPEILDFIPAGQAADFPKDVFVKLVSSGRLFGFPLSGYRCAVDSAERLAEARATLASRSKHA